MLYLILAMTISLSSRSEALFWIKDAHDDVGGFQDGILQGYRDKKTCFGGA